MSVTKNCNGCGKPFTAENEWEVAGLQVEHLSTCPDYLKWLKENKKD